MQSPQTNSVSQQLLDAVLPPRDGRDDAFEALLNRILPPREYHLPGQHDQCDHSVTGECVEEEPKGERAELFKAEREITKSQDREVGVFFDKTGTEVYRKLGESDHLAFKPDEDLSRFKDHIFSHNHPGDARSFSGTDLIMANLMNFREIRVVGESTMGKFTYVMKRPDNGWPELGHFMDRYKKIDGEVQSALIRQFKKKTINLTFDNLNFARQHIVNSLVAKQLGIDYKRIRIKRK